MIILTEDDVARFLTPEKAKTILESLYAEIHAENGRNFPVIREHLSDQNAVFGIKSGVSRSLGLGLKAGGYWPQNQSDGLTNHQSTVLLFNPESGQPQALVPGNLITALRTAASCAVAIDQLARRSVDTIGILGAGHQATFHLEAALKQRDFKQILAWNRTPEKISTLEEIGHAHGIPVRRTSLKETVENADVLISILLSNSPVVEADWIQPGCHISCMGTDTVGKQELDAEIFRSAEVFTDDLTQSISIGEAQHAIKKELTSVSAITHIGAVIAREHPGRIHNDQITLFDGTGIALQDIACAKAVLDLSAAR